MTDEKALRDKIEKSGYKLRFIAKKIGMSYQSLLNKMSNKSDFRATEIQALCSMLNISVSERDLIFFKSV